MKCNIFTILKKLCIPITVFIAIINLNATAHQYEQIEICSLSQLTNLTTNTVIFQGKVTLKYQNINIYADKISIRYISDKYHLPIIKAYGNPVTLLYQNKKINDTISAQSLIIHYNINNNIIHFIGNACIKQNKNSIHSDKITYIIKEKKIEAIANQNHQVITNFLLKY